DHRPPARMIHLLAREVIADSIGDGVEELGPRPMLPRVPPTCCRPDLGRTNASTTVSLMQLTDDLVQAVCETLDREAREDDQWQRAVLLAWARLTLSQWRAGTISTEQAVTNLRAPHPRPRHRAVYASR